MNLLYLSPMLETHEKKRLFSGPLDELTRSVESDLLGLRLVYYFVLLQLILPEDPELSVSDVADMQLVQINKVKQDSR